MCNLNSVKYNLSQSEIDSIVKTTKLVKFCGSIFELNGLLEIGISEIIDNDYFNGVYYD